MNYLVGLIVTLSSISVFAQTAEDLGDVQLRYETIRYRNDFCKELNGLDEVLLKRNFANLNEDVCGDKAIDLENARIGLVGKTDVRLFYITADLNGNGNLTSEEQTRFYKLMNLYFPSLHAYRLYKKEMGYLR